MATSITEEQRKQLVEDHEKGILLKNSLKIVDKLAKLNIDDIIVTNMDVNDTTNKLEDLIEEAKKLVKNRFFILK